MQQQTAIVAQIAITALSLDGLSQVHWVCRAAFTVSLVTSLSCVYYASNQYQNLGRLTSPEDLESWVKIHSTAIVESMVDEDRGRQFRVTRKRSQLLPSAAMVITLAAPRNLFSASVLSFLVGYGVYAGQVWTRGLDPTASPEDSRAVFITYVTVLLLCRFIYVFAYEVQGTGKAEYGYAAGGGRSWAAFKDEQSLEQEIQLEGVLQMPRAREVNRANSNDTADMGISEAFQEAARLHQRMAAVDQRLAELLEESSRRGPRSETQEAPNNPTSEG